MSLQKHKKTYGVFLAIIIALIVISFVFTGVSRSPTGGVDTVAMVGKTPIRNHEYQMAVEQTMQFANNYLGGKLREEDKQMLRKRALDRLIQGKLLLNLANKLDIHVSEEEIMDTIKSLPYFKTKQGFSLEMYKQALAYQGLTPKDFEDSLSQDLKIRELSELFQGQTVSKQYIEDVRQFKEKKLNVTALRFSKRAMEQFIAIDDTEINKYLTDPANQAKIKAIFESRRPQLDQPEQVKARHILLKVDESRDEESTRTLAMKVHSTLNAKNFSKKADELTQDPSGKGKGGDLGWFSRGRMVPEFEDEVFRLKVGEISVPIKTQFGYHIAYVEAKKDAQLADFKNYQKALAKEALQAADSKKLEALVADLENKFAQVLSRNNKKELSDIQKNYKVQLVEGADLNLFDSNAGGVALDVKSVEQIFNHPKPETEVFRTRDAANITLVRVNGKGAVKGQDKSKLANLENDSISGSSQNMAMTEKLFQELLKKEQEKTKIKIFKQI